MPRDSRSLVRGTEAVLPAVLLSRAWQPVCGARTAGSLSWMGGHCPFGCASPHSSLGFCRDKPSLALPSAATRVSQQPGQDCIFRKGQLPRIRRGRNSPSSLLYFSAIRTTLWLSESLCLGLCLKPYSPGRGFGSGSTACGTGEKPQNGTAFPRSACGLLPFMEKSRTTST